MAAGTAPLSSNRSPQGRPRDGRDDPWGRSAFERRQRIYDPVLGEAWFISPEDLILAKLAWSDGGASERQLRDWPRSCAFSPIWTGSTSTAMRVFWEWAILWSGSVATDSAQAVLDRRLIEVGLAGRRAVHVALRRNGFARVWAAVDRAGPMTPLEEARFVLRRLYPDLEGPRLEVIMSELGVRFVDGTWSGFRRPSSEG